MKANDLRKGDRVLLKNGWYATMADNKKGNIRLATVEGFETEMGSIYMHDVAWHVHSETNVILDAVEEHPSAKKTKAALAAMGW